MYGENDNLFENCELLDASYEAMVIKKIISADSTFQEDYVDDGVESELLNKALGYIKRILSKEITAITVVEIEGKLDDSQILPYIRIYKNQQFYDNLQMGQGEHKVLYLIWKLLTAKKNAIILLEEPEAFLCSKSQEHLMDFLVYIAQEKTLHIILTTHSDLVLKKQNITSCSIVKLNSNDKIFLVRESSKSKYLSALGLTPPIKGVLLVEDRFAKAKLHEIFLQSSSTFRNEYHIDVLNGESHILEIAKHYNSSNIHLIPVLDGDMIGKVNSTDYLIPLVFLPNRSQLAPEWEVVNFIRENIALYAENILHENEACINAINSVFANNHDWFQELDDELEYGNKEGLEKIAINLWIKENQLAVGKFLVMLEHLKSKITAKLLFDDSKGFHVNLKNQDFSVCSETVNKYRLDRWIGEIVALRLAYIDSDISCVLEIT